MTKFRLYFYATLCAVILISLVATFTQAPILPVRGNDTHWLRTWLIFSVVDFYGVALCLCGIILATGGLTASSLAWCAGICILGAPVACIYIVWRLSKGSIALQGDTADYYEPRSGVKFFARRLAVRAHAGGGRTGKPHNRPGHWTLKSPHEQYLEAKKSKFYAFAWPVQSSAAARETISVHSDPKASHNCSAFLISGTNSHCTDDGEPSGTAGRPILSAIEAEGLQGVAVLVIRYYGGIKLGTGGLARAYGGAARLCLQDAERVFVPDLVRVHIKAPTPCIGNVYNALASIAAHDRCEEYAADGSLELAISVEEGESGTLEARIRDATAGAASVEVDEP